MADSKSEIVVYSGADRGGLVTHEEPVTARNAPAIVKAAGRSAEFAWEEFFQAEIANAHTRKNYLHAVRKFLAWVEDRGLDLPRITPGDVGAYLEALAISTPTKCNGARARRGSAGIRCGPGRGGITTRRCR